MDVAGVSLDELEEFVPMMCKALNDPKRILILLILGDAPRTVSELVGLIGAPQANISQHLAVLRDRGIIEAQRDGSNVWYRLRYPEVLEALSVLRGIFHAELRRKGSMAVEVRAGDGLDHERPMLRAEGA
jgi:DNA-binding transcriptional ArsR family regulator